VEAEVLESEERFVAKQRIDKHVSTATDTHVTLGSGVFYAVHAEAI
jgi:hypothetical protein